MNLIESIKEKISNDLSIEDKLSLLQHIMAGTDVFIIDQAENFERLEPSKIKREENYIVIEVRQVSQGEHQGQ